jgi:predicted amidohydrolase
MRIHIFQFDISWLNPQKNLATIDSQLDRLDNDIDLMVLPEMFLSGFCMNPTLSAVLESGQEVVRLIDLAREYKVGIIGSLAIKEEGKYYNRVLLISEHGIIGRYDKQRLFSPSGENDVFDSKYDTNIMEFNGWKILPQVCYDLRFPENVRPLPAPDILIYMANWPMPRINHWKILLKARAIENQCYVIGCNRIGIDGNKWEYSGQSAIIKADGTTVVLNENNEVQVVTLSLSEINNYRQKYKFLEDKEN